jgi:hypothetical protein
MAISKIVSFIVMDEKIHRPIAMTNDTVVVGIKMSAHDESSGKKYDRHQSNQRKSARYGNPRCLIDNNNCTINYI